MKRVYHDSPLVIPICVDDERALYDEFDPTDQRLSDAFKGYLEDFIEDRKPGEGVRLELTCSNGFDMERFRRAYRLHIDKLRQRNQRQRARKTASALRLLGIGVAFVLIGIAFARNIRLVKGYRKHNSGYFFRAESFFNVATVTNLQYNDDGRLPDYHAQSHGESFLSFLQDEAQEGVYLMDEPEAALSPQRQLTLMLHIHSMALEGSQFIIATHSPILLGMPEARILSFTDEGIHPIRYEDTESYQITKLFLGQRESLLNKLFNGAED